MHRVACSLIRERFRSCVSKRQLTYLNVGAGECRATNFIETRFNECGELTGLATLEIGQELGCVCSLSPVRLPNPPPLLPRMRRRVPSASNDERRPRVFGLVPLGNRPLCQEVVQQEMKPGEHLTGTNWESEGVALRAPGIRGKVLPSSVLRERACFSRLFRETVLATYFLEIRFANSRVPLRVSLINRCCPSLKGHSVSFASVAN